MTLGGFRLTEGTMHFDGLDRRGEPLEIKI